MEVRGHLEALADPHHTALGTHWSGGGVDYNSPSWRFVGENKLLLSFKTGRNIRLSGCRHPLSYLEAKHINVN